MNEEYVPFTEILAVHLHRDMNGDWYAIVTEKDTRTGRVRHRRAFQSGGTLSFDASDTKMLGFEENR